MAVHLVADVESGGLPARPVSLAQILDWLAARARELDPPAPPPEAERLLTRLRRAGLL